MGQKSRQKKNRQQHGSAALSKKQSTQSSASRGISLADLDSALPSQPTQSNIRTNANSTNLSYEMIGNLPQDIRKIGLIILGVIVIISVLAIVNTRSSILKEAGNKASSFMQLQ